jgi:CRP-like cAMP-binding protein
MLPYLVHVGYIVMLCGFLARDVLTLRALLVAGQTIVATYAWLIAVRSIGAWNVLFASINLAWVVVILRARRAVHLPADLRPLYDGHFTALTPREFLRWWNTGMDDVLTDVRLTWEGQQPASLYFVRQGTVRVSRSLVTVTDLPAGFFVAEMSLLTGHPANADVDALGSVRVHRWDRADLVDLRARDAGLWIKIQSAIGLDLVRKIGRTDAQV